MVEENDVELHGIEAVVISAIETEVISSITKRICFNEKFPILDPVTENIIVEEIEAGEETDYDERFLIIKVRAFKNGYPMNLNLPMKEVNDEQYYSLGIKLPESRYLGEVHYMEECRGPVQGKRDFTIMAMRRFNNVWEKVKS